MTKVCYAVMRHGLKLHNMAAVRAVAAHNSRTAQTPNADPTRANRVLVGSGDFSRDVITALPGKRRKNAVLAREVFLSASPEFFERGGSVDEWADAAVKFLRRQYNSEQLVGTVLHVDEQTPHIHAIIVPLRGDGKLDARSLWTRKFLQESQTNYAKACAHLGLTRGVEGSKAMHESISDYYRRVNDKCPEFPPEIEQVREKIGFFDKEYRQLVAAREQELREREAKIKVLARSAHAKGLEFDSVKKRLHERELLLDEMRRETVRVREMPLEHVLESMGCSRDPADPRRNWRTPVGRITVTNDKFYCHDLNEGGGGAIDLVMMLDACDFTAAIRTLGGNGFDRDAVVSAAMRRAANEIEKPAFIEPAEGDFDPVRRYLVGVRGVPAQLVERVRAAGLVYADRMKNCVFRLQETGRTIGVELRGTWGGFHGTRGRKGLFELDDRARAEPGVKARAVFVESAIEALSYAALQPGNLVIGTGGENPLQIARKIKSLQGDGFQIVAAQNRDSAGEKQAAFVLGEAGFGSERERPEWNDWNDDLRNGDLLENRWITDAQPVAEVPRIPQ